MRITAIGREEEELEELEEKYQVQKDLETG